MQYSSFESRGERHRIAADVLLQIAGPRVAVVVLDDVHRARDGLEFCRYVFDDCEGDRPVLFVATVGETTVGRSERDEQSLRQFCGRESVERIEVPPLADRDTVELVRDGLGLVQESAEATAERAEGSPLFAIELVRHWAEVDNLERTADGFVVERPALRDVPTDVRRVWEWRLHDVLGDLPIGETSAATELLVLGALMGRNVREREWRRAAETYSGTDFEFDRLLAPIVRRGLLIADDDGWHFAHGLLREVLTDWFDDERRIERFHAAIAEALVDCHGKAPSSEAERIAEHFLEAEATERALDFFERAADWYLEAAHRRKFREILARYRGAVGQVADEERHRRMDLRCDLLEQTQLFRQRTPEPPDKELSELFDRARQFGGSHERALAHHLVGFQQRDSGDSERAVTHYRQASQLVDPVEWPSVAFKIATGFGDFLVYLGKFEEARSVLDRAMAIAERADFRVYKPAVLASLGYLELLDGQLEAAEATLSEALTLSRETGARTLEPRLRSELGEVYRERGDFEAARQTYERALEQFRELQDRRIVLASVNLGLLHLLEDRLPEAESYFRSVVRRYGEATHPVYKPASLLGLTCCAAEFGNWEKARQRFRQAREELAAGDAVTVDFARLAERLFESAREAGRREFAEQAAELAVRQRRSLDDEERAEEIEQRCRALGEAGN